MKKIAWVRGECGILYMCAAEEGQMGKGEGERERGPDVFGAVRRAVR